MAKLTFITGKLNGHVYQLVRERTTVGRGSENLLCIQDSSISREHCEILVNGAEVIVRDLGSRNGTSLNGRRLIKGQQPLLPDQIVQFGAVQARLELEDDTGSSEWNLSAIHDLATYLRERERAKSRTTESAMSFDNGSSSDQSTMLLPAVAQTFKGDDNSATASLKPPHRSRRALALFALIGAVITFALVSWLIRNLN